MQRIKHRPNFFSIFLIGAKNTNDITYLFNFGRSTEEVASEQASIYWPKCVISFWTERLEWTQQMNNDGDGNADSLPKECDGEGQGEPDILCKFSLCFLSSNFIFFPSLMNSVN